MEYKIALYNNEVTKTKLPTSSIAMPAGFKPVVNRDYIIKKTKDCGKVFNEIFEAKTMVFSVKHIIYRNYENNFAVLSGNILEYQNGNEIPPTEIVTFTGYFYNLYKDATYECEGYWTNLKNGKQQFNITAYTQIKSGSITIIEEYLKNILSGLKISPQTIKRIVNLFSFDTLDKIKADDPELDTIIKKESRRKAVVQRVLDQEEKEKALQYLAQWGISINTTMSIIESLGTSTYSIIKHNPNILFGFPINSKTIDRIAKAENHKFNDPLRVEGFIRRYIMEREKIKGDIYIDYDEFIPNPSDLLFSFSRFSSYVLGNGCYKESLTTLTIDSGLKNLQNKNQIVIEDNISDITKKCVYRQYYSYAENVVVEKIKNLVNDICTSFIPTSSIDSDIDDIQKSGFVMDIMQKQAVRMALQNKISILSGGPGTGKTQTTKAIVEIFHKNNPNAKIQLCAPTGKASRRMSEVINLPASTIHKTLNYIPFSQVEINEIDADLLIIDETSMMDIDLFCKVLSNIEDNTSILLVGDYNQLPSVGPGLILRDLIDSGKVPATLLTKVFRQSKGSKIISAAYDILNDKPENIARRTKDDFIFYDTTTINQSHNIIKKYLIQMINSGISPEQIQIITPANDGIMGVTGLNSLAKSIINPDGYKKGEITISPTRTFSVGDRVIQIKNNYNLMVFNGTIGTIKAIDSVKEIATIEFDGNLVDYVHKDLLDLKLGYAITAHKSQGSEFEYVIMPIVSEHSFVSNRNLLYTAVTRAKRKFILVGEDIALQEVCHKIEHFSRKSQIKEKLSK